VDKTIQHTRSPVGGVKRLTAAVVVNYRRKTDEQGKVTSVALAPQEIEQINALVKEAMGFSQTRGDSLNVLNTAFNAPEQETLPDVPWWKQRDNISMGKDIGKYLLLAVVIGYLFFGVLRPGVKRAFKVVEPPELQSLAGPNGEQTAEEATQQRGDQLLLARKMARDDPKVVANVVKSWVSNDG
jgi:flagellar M-ring protein FliF